MTSIERSVRTWIASGRENEIESVVNAISNGEATLLDVVKALGEFLTAEEDDVRNKGVELLSQVVNQLPSDKLNRQAVRVLVTFMCEKLDDTETIIPALKALKALVSKDAFTSSDAVEVANALFRHVKMKVLVQAQRFVVYGIIDGLVARHRDALINMGPDFVSGYIKLAEGEKDPRNLLLAFAIARVLLIEFDTAKYIEDLFNITFCYFPITFRPPPDDPYGITTEDLKEALRGCLNATPAFGPMAIPLFLEKITAGSPATKRDTLQTLDICLPVCGSSVAKDHARKLWNTFRLEIFQPTDVETENMALNTTQVLVRTIYQTHGTEIVQDEEIEGLAKDVCEECLKILKEPEKNQAKHAIKVMCAFVSTTPSVAKFTLSQAVPHLVQLFLNPDEIQNRSATLKLLADLIDAVRESVIVTTADEEKSAALSPYKDEVLGVFTVGLKTVASCGHALEGLKAMVLTPHLLVDEELGFVVHNINEVLTNEETQNDEDISDSILDLLTTVSSISSRHVSQTTLPLLFSSLPDQAPARDAEADRLKYWHTLSFLKRLCLQSDLFEMLVIRLSTKLDLICVPASSTIADSDHEPTAAYAHSILRTLADTLARKVELGHTDVSKYSDRLVPRLYNLHFYSTLVSNGDYLVATDPRLISVSAEIVTLVIQTALVGKQETFVKNLFGAYFDGKPGTLAEGQHKLPGEKPFAPFSPDATSLQKNLVVLFSAALVPLHKEVALPVPNESKVLETLVHWTIQYADNVLQREAAEHSVAAILNKRADSVADFLSSKVDLFWADQAERIDLPLEHRRKAISLWIWITKGLLVRGHSLAQRFANRLFDLFGDASVSWDAARAIGEIARQDKILTKKNHAVVKFLFAQRFANSMLPKIIDGVKSSSDPNRQNAFLVALTSLIKSIPKSAYIHEMFSLLPLLLRGLELPDHNIRANVIDTLLSVADPSSKLPTIAEHANSLVSTMLKNSIAKKMPSTRVRIAALQYLATLPSIVRYDVLHPQRALVLRELAGALDDPKRAVRKEAVEARTVWFKYTG
ncbi:ARM repeat-containing protein [Irpex rosettiformis]|uniref:ARM repeat-containing protein n=1 Tax=Irpex rosettiformis TaxID=378272 RepID=A0ACB8UB38_9APHY|nr:ARM repeat-containing protein [Irpex rosettiformis]